MADGAPQERPGVAACPACSAMPAATADVPEAGRIMLSLPGIHCAGCISTVENGLARHPGIRSARVNLTLRRVVVDAALEITAEDLVPVMERLGYEAHVLDQATLGATEHDSAGRDLLMRVGVSGFAMMNVMLLSVAVWSGAEGSTRDMLHWISAAIALPTIAFASQPFFRSGWSALRAGRLNMDVPISLAILLAAAMSLYETSQSGHHAYFDAAVALTFFLLAGRYLDYRTRASARSAARELAALEVPKAMRLVGGVPVSTAVGELVVGDLLLIRPGARLPVDGDVIEGRSETDRSLLTGESLPVPVGPGTRVAAGEMNLTGPLQVRVTAVGQETSLQRMAALVALAETARNRYTSLADRAAQIYAPGVHLLALFAFLGWIIATGDMRLSINIAIAVLIITCPCALGLAVPAVTTAASARLFRRGVLLKNGTALERLAEVDTVVFDKTGTLTLGTPVLEEDADRPDEDLALAAALGQGSAHPLAASIAAEAQRRGLVLPAIDAVTEHPGEGIEAEWRGRRVRLGRAAWVGADAASRTATWLALDGAAPRPFYFRDAPRPGTAALIAALKAQGLEIHLLSGDTAPAVAAFAAEMGISEARAQVLPADKLAHVADLEEAGRRVLMVGDGLNDTGALAAAHVSVSPASALDAARVASDIVLLGRDIDVLAGVLVTARMARRRITENFVISAAYNIVAIPVAFMGFATPLAAALAMSISSITVSLNALRLR
ncbi:MAG: cadmium-translocating P-type ATPase [Rhodobacteraceae bacterium]|nr:cadmium-translocating P-type ATPase [Paracoccaceae bacterium]